MPKARAGGLSPVENITVVGEELVIVTGAGQEPHIRSARSEIMAELARWERLFLRRPVCA